MPKPPLAALVLAATFASLAVTPARANVFQSAPNGFVIRHAAEVPASAERTFDELVNPARWWNAAHSYSGDAENFSIDDRAGGCFCEVLPDPEAPRASPRGSVEHMRVIYVERGRVLRMTGGLGPLQAEPLSATLTVVLKPVGGAGGERGARTQILWEYVVGGYLRMKPEQIAPAVDAVLGDQIGRLAANLGAEPAAADGSGAEAVKPAEKPVGEQDKPEADAPLPEPDPLPKPAKPVPPAETYGPTDPEMGR